MNIDTSILQPSSAESAKPSGAERAGKNDSSELEKAGKEFEALMIAQLLKSVRETGDGGWLGSGGGDSNNSILQLAETQLAQAMAERSAFGIAALVMSQQGLEGRPASGGPPEVDTANGTWRSTAP